MLNEQTLPQCSLVQSVSIGKHSCLPFLPWTANVSLLIEATNTSSVSSLLVGISSVLAMGEVRLDGIVAGEKNVVGTD